MTEPRRRRRRATAEQGPPPPQATVAAPTAEAPVKRKPRTVKPSGDGGLRDIVGSGSSALSLSAALRVRDLNRPTEADLAEAERNVVIVRRNWKPPAS